MQGTLDTVVPVLLGALFGAVFGSFLNVVRVRMPEGQSLLLPGSHCMHCNRPLAWWQNIPLLSWLLLRGRCHACGTSIPILYPLVELTMAVLWAGCAAASIPTAAISAPMGLQQAVAWAIFCWIMVLLAALDWEHFWLPDRVTFPAIAMGLLWHALRATQWPLPLSLLQGELLRAAGLSTLGNSVRSDRIYGHIFGQVLTALLFAALAALSGAAIVLLIRLLYWLVRRREGMGLGDAKLLAALGAWLGFRAMIDAFLVAVLAASLAALLGWAVLRWRRSFSSSPDPSQDWSQQPLPLGSFLAVAALVELFQPAWLLQLWTQHFLS